MTQYPFIVAADILQGVCQYQKTVVIKGVVPITAIVRSLSDRQNLGGGPRTIHSAEARIDYEVINQKRPSINKTLFFGQDDAIKGVANKVTKKRGTKHQGTVTVRCGIVWC